MSEEFAPPTPRSWVEIRLGAICQNAALARQQSGADVMAVVKANAYGHGALAVARALEGQVAYFGVANLHEARQLVKGGITTPVLLLSACLPEEEEYALRSGIHVCISTLAEAESLNLAAEKLGLKAHAHIALDTGMGRMGFLESEWSAETVTALLACSSIVWEGLATHMPSPDEDPEYTRQQVARFRRQVELAWVAGLQPVWVHAANSGGVLGYPETQGLCNLARPGLMLYGVNPLADVSGMPPAAALEPVLTWKARVTLIRDLPAGHGVSYGRTFITTRPARVATLACGYADGYPRQLSGQGARVLIRGQSCPVLGRVTMDQIMVDVTDLADAAEAGDEAVLLGAQGDAVIPPLELAAKAGTITWHIFTSIGDRVQRVYV